MSLSYNGRGIFLAYLLKEKFRFEGKSIHNISVANEEHFIFGKQFCPRVLL